jgi:hypothetical protein
LSSLLQSRLSSRISREETELLGLQVQASKQMLATVEALRQAQQQLIASANHQHPFYWAAFTLLGNWG